MYGQFTLGSGTGGIDPGTQTVTIAAGGYVATIPAGSFRGAPNGAFLYAGTINGAALYILISPTGANTYQFAIRARNVDLTSDPNPVKVGIRIGNRDAGTLSVAATIVN